MFFLYALSNTLSCDPNQIYSQKFTCLIIILSLIPISISPINPSKSQFFPSNFNLTSKYWKTTVVPFGSWYFILFLLGVRKICWKASFFFMLELLGLRLRKSLVEFYCSQSRPELNFLVQIWRIFAEIIGFRSSEWEGVWRAKWAC